ncbi:hypothetical protein L6452_18143 [Arctium lappa]|uniref:Uncharacterized protein n=1 Tax=Arctium lappa TaxID=4217 RepID=A0ACB9C5P6_ARCLA|nr:hypothetical protein L6452_18143 [Arctium lappa]
MVRGGTKQKNRDDLSSRESTTKDPSSNSITEIDFLTEAEIEESIRAEKLIAECQQDATLTLKVQSSQFKDALRKSKSTYRGYVEGINDALINRVDVVLKVPSALPPKPRQLKRNPASSSSENVAAIKNDTSIKFSREALFGPPPDLSVLDLSLPPGGPFLPGQDLLCLWCTYSPLAKPIISIIRKESVDRRQKEEEVPDYMIKVLQSHLDRKRYSAIDDHLAYASSLFCLSLAHLYDLSEWTYLCSNSYNNSVNYTVHHTAKSMSPKVRPMQPINEGHV